MRKANKFDLAECFEMMQSYALEGPIDAFKDKTKHNQQYIEELLMSIIAGRGFVLIEEGKGIIVAAIVPNLWIPEIRQVKELAWWVRPEHRGGLTGGKLFLGFQKYAQELIDVGRADFMSMTLMESSPRMNFESKGFRPIETTFVR